MALDDDYESIFVDSPAASVSTGTGEDDDYESIFSDPKKPKKPFTGRGTIAARNAAAARTAGLGERGAEFQQIAAVDATRPAYMGRAEEAIALPGSIAAKRASMQAPEEVLGAKPLGVMAAITDVAQGAANLMDYIPAQIAEGNRISKASQATREYLDTGKITITPERKARYGRYGMLESPAVAAEILEGSAAEKYLRDLSTVTENTATSGAFMEEAGMFNRALGSVLTQPEQLGSLVGAVAGGTVGMAPVGAAIGMVPLLRKAFDAEYFYNMQAGMNDAEARQNAWAKLAVEGATEMIPGLGGLAKSFGGRVLSESLSEGASGALSPIVDVAFQGRSDTPEAYTNKIPNTLGEYTGSVLESALAGGLGASAMEMAPVGIRAGADATRFALDKRARDVPKTRIKLDPKINEALAAQQGIAAKPADAPTKPQYSSFVASILEDPNVKAVFDSLQDPAARQKMLDDLSLADTLKKEGNERKQLSMKKAAADREWVKTNPITSHPSFAEADAAVRGGATTVDKLRKAVPNLSRITAPLVIKHLEEAGVVSAPDNKKQRTVLQPSAPAPGTTQNNIALPVQPAIQPTVQSDNTATTQNNNVEQKSVLTLPEDVPSIAQEPEAVNTPAPTQTETVQVKTPKVGNYQPVAGGYESRVTAHTLGSNALDPTADAGALIYEYRKEGQAGPPMTMVVGKSGKLIPASQAVTGNKSSGEAWIPPTKDAGDAVRALLLNRGNLDAAGRAENSTQIAAIVAPRVEPKGPIRLKPMPTKVAEEPVAPVEVVPATGVAAPTQNAAVAPPVQPQAPVEVAPTGLTPQTKARRQEATKAAAPQTTTAVQQATPAAEPTAIGKSKVEAQATKVLDAKLVAETAAKDAEEIPFIRGVHEDYMKARGKSAEGTYVQQVLDGQTPTAQPTADDAAFVKTLGWSLPETAVPAAETTTTAPTTAATTPASKPAKQPRAKTAAKPTPQEAAVAKAQAEVAADKQEKERIAAKIPSDAELVGAGLSPAEVTLLKKNPEQHREVLDAVNRGEIRVSSKEAATPTGMRPVTDEDITKAKTRPEKDKLTRLKAKYEQATDAPRKLSPASITNVRKEAIARAYERIKQLAQSPNMSQFDAIPNDPESTKAILGLQAEAQKTATTEAELAKKLEDTYVNNYKRNHPEVKEGGNVSDVENEAPAAVNETPSPTVVAPVPAGVFVHESNGVYASSGVSEALRGLTSMWRDILTISPKVYITTFADLTANKSLFTGKYATILSLNRYGSANGIKSVLSDGSYIIALNSALTTSQTLEVLGHELGHVHQEVAFNSADDAMKSQLYAAYDAWADSNAQPTTPAKQLITTRAPRSIGRKIGATARPGMTVNNLSNPVYWRSFNEWYADQVARWATTSAVPLTAVEKFFSRLGMAMRAFFNRAHNAKYLPDPRFSAYMAAVTKVAKANPTLGTRVGGDMAIEENANIVTATPPLTDTTGIGPEATIQRIKDVFFGMIRNRGIASPDAQAMIEERSGLESAMMLEAEFAVDHVRQALVDALHGVSKATREIYNNNLLKYLNGDRSAVLPAPLVQRLTELRKLIDDRSLALIALGVIPKDKIATVLQNFGKWTHRDFQAFQMAPGIQNKKGVWAKHVEQMKADGKRDLVAENIEALKNDMRLPSKAEIARMGKDARDKNSPTGKATEAQLLIWSLRWGLNTEKMSGKNSILSKLKELSDMGEAKLVEKANEYAKAMLDPLYLNAPVDPHGEFNPKAGVYADDSSVSQDRTPLPQWLKNLWGEYTKWDTVAMITLENQSKMIAKYIALTRYKARLLASNQLFEATDTRSKRGYALLDSKVYGPLNGYYIPEKDLWLIQSGNTLAAIDAAYGARARGEDSLLTKAIEMYKGIVKFLGPIGAALKVVQVLYSHLTAFVNLATTSISMSGVIPRFGALKHLGNSAKVARASAFGGVGILTAKKSAFGGKLMVGRALEPGTELNRQLMFLASKNMLHDSVLAADTRRKYKQQLQAEVRANLKMGHGAMLVVKDAIPWSIDRASRVNSFGDEIAKHLSWASRVDALTTIFPSMSEAEVWGLAAKEVMATMPSYIHAWPIARAVSSMGIFGPYMTFNTEVLRNAGNSLLLAKHYAAMDSSAARVYAAQELASVAVRLMGAGLLNTFVLGSMAFIAQSVLGTGGDDDEEKKLIEAQREAAVKYNSGQGYSDFRNALPDYVHGHVTVLRDLGNGKYTFYSAQRYDISVFGSLMEAAVYGDGEEYGSIFTDTFASLTASVPALTKMAAGWASSKKASEGTVAYDDAINTMEAGKKELKEAFTPGTIKTLLRTSDAAEKGVELTPDERLFNHTGFTVQIFDSHTTLSMAAADYNGLRLRTTRSVKEQMREEAPELDFQAATLAKLSLWERTRKKVENFKGLGMDYDTVYAAVKDNPISDSIPEDELVGLYENVFQMPNYIETVEDIRDQALVKAGEDTAEVERIIALYDKYIEQADQSDIQMRAILESQGVTVR